MKKMIIMAMMMAMTIAANAMSYTEARAEALFLSDKMAFELNLTNAQLDDIYEINLDYMMSMGSERDLYGSWWSRRNADLRFVLSAQQYKKYVGLSYFYRPVGWRSGAWVFNIYTRYSNRGHYYKSRPTVYVSYRGGNNRREARYYADRHHTRRVAPAHHDRVVVVEKHHGGCPPPARKHDCKPCEPKKHGCHR